MVQLTPSVRGRVHPTDVSDDFEVVAKGQGPLTEDEIAKCYVLKVNPSTKIIDLSTRQSRLEPDSGVDIIDKEIQGVQDLKEGMQIRGLVKNVSDHGVFVALGRNTTARVMIKELFDEYVKDWQSRFEVNQLVSGKIVSIDQKKRTVEMTLKKNPDSKASKKVALLGLSDFTEGQKVVAVVKKVEAYGMFLKIEGSDISGLCHKSEVSGLELQDQPLLHC
jgi:rRNA biogenesis protein RRP5